jgi:hypothetical protein
MPCLTDDCPRPPTLSGHCIPCKFEKGVRVNGLRLMAHDRDLGLTQGEKDREQQQAARRDGRDIMRVPGRRGAHERRTEHGWEKI